MYLAIIFSGIALLLVFESLIPFISPAFWRKMLLKVCAKSDQTMRRVALFGLITGTVIMLAVHSLSIS